MTLSRALSLSLSALALVAVTGGVALADIAPPDDYVEECTLEKQQVPGVSCVECANGYDNSGNCAALYDAEYDKTCQTWGGSFWTELWCQGEPTTPTDDVGEQPSEETSTTTPKDKSSGCSVAGVAGGQTSMPGAALGGLLAAMVGLVVAARRRV